MPDRRGGAVSELIAQIGRIEKQAVVLVGLGAKGVSVVAHQEVGIAHKGHVSINSKLCVVARIRRTHAHISPASGVDGHDIGAVIFLELILIDRSGEEQAYVGGRRAIAPLKGILVARTDDKWRICSALSIKLLMHAKQHSTNQ